MNIKKNITIFCLILFICSTYIVLTLQIVNSQKIAYGIKIANLSLSGKCISDSKEFLKNEWNNFAKQELKFVYNDKSWLINLTDLGFELNSQENIGHAYFIGHGSNFFINSKNQIASLFGLYNLQLSYQINQEQFQNKTEELLENIEKPAQNATLFFNTEINDFSLQHSNQGITIDREQLIRNIDKQIKSFTIESIALELIIDEPEIQNNEVETAQKIAQRILSNQPYYLIFENEKYRIDKAILIDWIAFESIKEENSDNKILGFTLDNEKVKKYLNKFADRVDQPVVNAELETEGNKTTIFIPDQYGFEVKKDLTFNNLIKNILANPSIKNTNIIADKALPNIKLWQTNKLGIKKIIGQGNSNFAGSPANRKHNIKTAVEKLNGYILEPNEEFSFINFLGETGPDQGYLAELVIKKNKTIPEYGGGVCQVSTTFFRSAINSGLKITERQYHAFPVAYYNPQGFDATVYDPKPDLRFVNNTPDHLLIETYVQGNEVFVNFYGTDDKRRVEIKGPYILENNEDGSMKTVLTQEVYKLSGDELEKQIFYSNYKSPDLYPVETGENKEE